MKRFSIQMVDFSTPNSWYKQILAHFVQPGDSFEIRCWKEEAAEIQLASRFGKGVEENAEVSVRGTVTGEFLKLLLVEEPTDKSVYNKMTCFFTLHAQNGRCDLWSEHYGTEMTLEVTTEADAAFFEREIGRYPKSFSVGTY